jgi:hypothetical protein
VIEETYNWLILNIACTVCVFESVESLLSIDVSRTDASWKKENFQKLKNNISF